MQNHKFKKKIFSITLFCLGLSLKTTTFAAGWANVNTNLPGPYSVATGGPVAVIGNFYNFALILGGMLAFGSIVYAGVLWMLSQGNSSKISEAKDRIGQAFLGLLILFGAYILLNTINPELTILKMPTLTAIPVGDNLNLPGGSQGTPLYVCREPSATDPQTGAVLDNPAKFCYANSAASKTTCDSECQTAIQQDCVLDPNAAVTCSGKMRGGAAGGACPVAFTSETDTAAFAQKYGQQALAMAQGQSVIWSSSDANAQTNLTQLRAEYNKLLGLPGVTARENSVYRPLGYQQYFYDIKQAGIALNNLSGDAVAACADTKVAVDAARDKHTICRSGGQVVPYSACQVSQPKGCSPHVMGKAIDLSITGKSYPEVDALLSAQGIGLFWKGLPGDEFHFELRSPPAGCASN